MAKIQRFRGIPMISRTLARTHTRQHARRVCIKCRDMHGFFHNPARTYENRTKIGKTARQLCAKELFRE